MSFKIEGLNELSSALGKLARDKTSYNNLRYDVGKKHLENCAETVGESSGRLKSSYKREPWNGQKEWILYADVGEIVEAGTKVFYAAMVEDGHRNVKITRKTAKSGRVRRYKKEYDFVPGDHHHKRALEMTDKDIPVMVDDFIKGIGRKAGFDVS